jgi:hypothetical protein
MYEEYDGRTVCLEVVVKRLEVEKVDHSVGDIRKPQVLAFIVGKVEIGREAIREVQPASRIRRGYRPVQIQLASQVHVVGGYTETGRRTSAGDAGVQCLSVIFCAEDSAWVATSKCPVRKPIISHSRRARLSVENGTKLRACTACAASWT